MIRASKMSQMLYLITQYLKYYLFFFIGYAIFRTLLTQFLPEFSSWFMVLDLVIYWIFMTSFILRFEEVEESEDEKDSTFDRFRGTFLHVLLLWMICSGLMIFVNKVFQINTYPARLGVNTILGAMTVFGTLRLLDKRGGFFQALNTLGQLTRNNPVGTILICGLHASVAHLCFNMLNKSGLEMLIESNSYIDTSLVFIVFLLAFLSLVVYAAFYWVYRKDLSFVSKELA